MGLSEGVAPMSSSGSREDRPTPTSVSVIHEPPMRRLPDNASTEQIVLAYNEAVGAYARLAQQNASLTIEYRDQMEKRDTVTAAATEEFVVLGNTVRRVDDERVARMDERVAVIERQFVEPESMKRAKDLASIPPMRPEADSSHDLVKALGKAVADKFEEEVRNPGTPTTPSSEMVAKIAEETVQQIITRVRTAGRRSVEAEKLSARRRITTVIVVTSITTLGAIVTALAEHFSASERHREAPALVLPTRHS